MPSKTWIAFPLALVLLVPFALATPGGGAEEREERRTWYGPCTAYSHAHESVARSNGTNKKFAALESAAAEQNVTVVDYCATQLPPGHAVRGAARAELPAQAAEAAHAAHAAHAAKGANAGGASEPVEKDEEGATEDAGSPANSGRPEHAGKGRPDGAGKSDESGE